MRTLLRLCSTLLALVLAPPCAIAAPDEIEVYTDESSKPGHYGLKLHLNHSIQDLQTPA